MLIKPIPVHILQLSALVVMDSLAALFNESLQSGIFPSDWKKANVYPVFKAGDSQLHYRPISVLSSIAKVFETIVLTSRFFRISHLMVCLPWVLPRPQHPESLAQSY